MLLGDDFSHNFSNKQKHSTYYLFTKTLFVFWISFWKWKFLCILIALKKKDLIFFSSLSEKCQFGQMTSIILFREKNKSNPQIHSIYSQLLYKSCNNVLLKLLY